MLIGVLAYLLYIQPSDAKLETDNYIIQLTNDMVRAGVQPGKIESRTAEEILQDRRRPAFWVAGLGLLLIGIGWAVNRGRSMEPRS